MFLCSACINLFDPAKSSNSNSSTRITHPLGPSRAENKIPITYNQVISLVEQYRPQLEEARVGDRFYTYEVNKIFGPSLANEPQCEDFLVYKKTVLKVDNNQISIFVQKDNATNYQCPGTITQDNCLETIDRSFELPDVGSNELSYFQTTVNSNPAILIEANYQDPQNSLLDVRVEAVTVLTRSQLISSYLDIDYIYDDGQVQSPMVKNLFYTNESLESVSIEAIDGEQIPNCPF